MTDPSGAVIPGVSVVAVQTETQVSYRGASNEGGYYTVGSLPIGDYSVTFSGSGFTEFTRSGVSLEAGQVARIDVALQVGVVAEKVTVSAQTEMIQTETAQASKAVDSKVFTSLPLSFGANGRNMAAFADKLVPGVNGAGYLMRIQGMPATSQTAIVDGLTTLSGRLPGDFAEASVSPEAIQELTVFTGNANAEFGRGSGGTLNFVLKAGTNQFHGSGFYYLQNEILNANDWNNNRMLAADTDFRKSQTRNFLRPRNRQQDRGFSAGGPVFLPKIYDGRNRTFFFFTLEKYTLDNFGPENLTRTVPQLEMWDGNLGRLLTGAQVGTDALGLPVYEGQIYDPKTLRQVDGKYVADPFLGNIIPASRISKVAQNLKQVFAKYYAPVTSSLQNNLYWTRRRSQAATQASMKLDHSFSTEHKLSGFYYIHDFPKIGPSGDTGLWSLADPKDGGPLASIRNQYLHGVNLKVSHDWVISPSLLNYASFGNVTENADNSNPWSGKGLAEQWGIKGVGQGLPTERITPPRFNLGNSPVMNVTTGWSFIGIWLRHYNNRVLTDTLSWQRRSHSIKVGFEWMRMSAKEDNQQNTGGTFGFQSRTTGIPGQPFSSRIGNSFASLLLGEVDSASLGVPLSPRVRKDTWAAFIQDDWKVTRKLTLNLGVRWGGDTPVYEKEDRIANFNPDLADPKANNMLGAVEYMGFGPGRADKRSPAPGYYRNVGPAFGLAYQLAPKTVLRASYSITYTPESIATAGEYQMVPGRFPAGFNQVNNVPANSKGIYLPVFNIDNGYPGVTQPRNLDPSWAQSNASTRLSPDMYKAGYVQQFHAGLQLQPASNLTLETSWRASKGTRLHAGESVLPNQIRPEHLSRGAVLGQVIDTPAKAAAAGLPYPFAGWKGTGANTLQPFPQVGTQSMDAWGDPVGFSTYHSGNLIVTKRTSKGFTAYGAYTFAKTISNVGRVIGAGESVGIQDSYSRTLYKSIDPADRAHIIKASLLWELPVGHGKPLLGGVNRFFNFFLGNWTVSTLFNYSSGVPLDHPLSRNQPVGWNGGDVFAHFNTPAGGFNRVFNPSTFSPENPGSVGNRFFDPKAFSDTVGQQLGTSPVRFPQIRMPWNFNEDAVLSKRFSIKERARIELRIELFNLLNRHHFGDVDLDMNNAYFGNLWSAEGNRVGQAGLRLEW